MGEQALYSASNSNPVFIVIMRNSRGKLFVYTAVLFVLCFIVFLLSSTHTSLKELEGVNEKCQQQRDSLSAQLQVVYEHKNRLEKSLNQEKTDHRHSKEENEMKLHELENKLQEDKDKAQKLEAQIAQLKSKFTELEEEKGQSENALTEQLKSVTSQKDKEIEKLQNHISELLSEKDKLETINNAKVWKLEQHENELKFCQVQHDQTRLELSKCQEQLKKLPINSADNFVLPSKAVRKDEKVVKNESIDQKISEDPKIAISKTETDKSTPHPPIEKKVFSKPHLLPGNAVGDGVLPKPEDIDAAVEVPELKRGERQAKMLNNGFVENQGNFLQELNKNQEIDLKIDLQKDLENHPQVAPPNHFDMGEKDDHAAERGEYGVQYAIQDTKQQIQHPVFNPNLPVKRKNPVPLPEQANNNDIAAQMRDMMIKSPGEVNNFDDPNAIHGAADGLGPLEEKIREFKNADGLLHRGMDGNNADDKNYEEDDDERENDDDQGNGMVMPEERFKGPHALQDNDFDDQENPENADNAKEEGVVVAPK